MSSQILHSSLATRSDVDNILGSMFAFGNRTEDIVLELALSERKVGNRADGRASQSRADILSAAAESFREHGFAATSIDDVARRLGATKGMIYHHFPSKTDLFFAVYRRGMDINFEAVQPYVEADMAPLPRLTGMAQAHARTMMEAQAFQRTVGQGVLMHQTGATTRAQRETLDELIGIRDRYESLFAEAIAKATQSAGGTVDDLSIATKSLLAVLNGTVHWYSPRSQDTARERDELAGKIVAFTLRGLGLEPDRESKS